MNKRYLAEERANQSKNCIRRKLIYFASFYFWNKFKKNNCLEYLKHIEKNTLLTRTWLPGLHHSPAKRHQRPPILSHIVQSFPTIDHHLVTLSSPDSLLIYLPTSPTNNYTFGQWNIHYSTERTARTSALQGQNIKRRHRALSHNCHLYKLAPKRGENDKSHDPTIDP